MAIGDKKRQVQYLRRRRRGFGREGAAPTWVVLLFISAGTAEQRAAVRENVREIQRTVRTTTPGAAMFFIFATSPDGDVGTLYSTDGRGSLSRGPLEFRGTFNGTADDAVGRRPGAGDPGRQLSGKARLLKNLMLQRFTRTDWARDLPQGTKTMLILFGHAQGVASALSSAGNPIYTAVGLGGFGYSPITGDALTASDIADALGQAKEEVESQGQKYDLDLLAFDSCYMSSSEASYELRGRADYLLVSQSGIPLSGFDYTALANAFAFKSKGLQATDVARSLIEQVGERVDAPRTLSLISLNRKLQECFRERLGTLSNEILSAIGLGSEPTRGNRAEWIRVRAAFESASWHRVRQFIDLSDLCYRLASYCHDREPDPTNPKGIRTAALALMRLLDGRPGVYKPEEGPLVVDTRSAAPWIFGGLSIYCSWLLPTPEEAAMGAWNAALLQEDYELLELFASEKGQDTPRAGRAKAARQKRDDVIRLDSWADIAWQKLLMEEARYNMVTREIQALRSAATWGREPSASTPALPPALPMTSAAPVFESSTQKPNNDGAFSDELLYTEQARSQAAFNPGINSWSRRY